MDEILLNLIVLCGFLLIGGVVVFFVRQQQKQKDQRLVELARQNGWRMEKIRKPLEKGTCFKFDDWVLETMKRSGGVEAGPGSSEWEEKTTWSSSRSGSVVLVGPKLSQSKVDGSLEIFARKIMQHFLGAEVSQVQEVFLGGQDFQEKYMVWANDEREAQRFVNPAVQAVLSSWQEPYPLIKRTSRGLKIELNGLYTDDPQKLLALVHLGEML